MTAPKENEYYWLIHADDRFLYGMALCSCIMLFFALAVPMGVALKFFAVAWTMVCFTVLGIAISEEI